MKAPDTGTRNVSHKTSRFHTKASGEGLPVPHNDTEVPGKVSTLRFKDFRQKSI